MWSDSPIFPCLWHLLYLHEVNLWSIHMWREHVTFVFSSFCGLSDCLSSSSHITVEIVRDYILDLPTYFQTLSTSWNWTTAKSLRAPSYVMVSPELVFMSQGSHAVATCSACSVPCSLTCLFSFCFCWWRCNFCFDGGSFWLLFFIQRRLCY